MQNTGWLVALCAYFGMAVPASAVELGKKRPIDSIPLETGAAAVTTDKIVGGTSANPGKFPFQVALIASRTPPGREKDGHFCGGTLIAKRWVLTAAHCVPNTIGEEVDVYIGSSVLPSGGPADAGAHRLSVNHIRVNQSYNDATKDNDIALLELLEDAPADITPARPATEAEAASLLTDGTPVTIIGWGATSEGGPGSSKLMEVTVKVQSSEACDQNYKQAIPSSGQIITNNMFCAGEPEGGKDSCKGDSGGFIGAVKDGKWVQLGAVSWGVGCARPKLFGVYTRLSNYAAWMEAVMR